MVQFQRKNKFHRQLEIISMRKNILSLAILLEIGSLRCLQLAEDSCPENSSPSQGTCECDLNCFKVSNTGNKFACIECIECKKKCEGRNFRCNEYKVHPVNSTQSCIPPPKGYFVHHFEFEKCSPECGRNEDETLKCGCNQNRRCECKRHFYKDSQGVCTKLCTKCHSHGHRRVSVDLGCTKMPWNERCVEETLASTPASTPAFTPKTTEEILVQTSQEMKRRHHNFTKKPFISTAKNMPNPNLTVDDGEDRVKKYKLYFPPLVCAFIVAIAMAFGIYKLYKRYRRNHITINYQDQEAGEIMPLASNNLPILDHAELVCEIPKAILDSVAEYWFSRFKSILDIPCTKALKDAYIGVAFRDDEDKFRIIMLTNNVKGCDYSTVMAHVKTRKPGYTLKNLLEHMFESGNHDLVNILAGEIMKNKEMYMKEVQARYGGSGTVRVEM